MKRLYIYCEGQTEESFVKILMQSYLFGLGIYVVPIICRTKEGPSIQRGGIVDYNKAIKEIRRYCLQHPHEFVTSFMDYYGLKNIPINSEEKDKYKNITLIEERMKQDVGRNNFIPYLSLHEFESLLFSKPEEFSYLKEDSVEVFNDILKQYSDNPELINNSALTAPSKRILNQIENYGKVSDGMIIAKNIGIEQMKRKCKHFSDWIDRISAI